MRAAPGLIPTNAAGLNSLAPSAFEGNNRYMKSPSAGLPEFGFGPAGAIRRGLHLFEQPSIAIALLGVPWKWPYDNAELGQVRRAKFRPARLQAFGRGGNGRFRRRHLTNKCLNIARRNPPSTLRLRSGHPGPRPRCRGVCRLPGDGPAVPPGVVPVLRQRCREPGTERERASPPDSRRQIPRQKLFLPAVELISRPRGRASHQQVVDTSDALSRSDFPRANALRRPPTRPRRPRPNPAAGQPPGAPRPAQGGTVPAPSPATPPRRREGITSSVPDRWGAGHR
jgi:hypothetical protein